MVAPNAPPPAKKESEFIVVHVNVADDPDVPPRVVQVIAEVEAGDDPNVIAEAAAHDVNAMAAEARARHERERDEQRRTHAAIMTASRETIARANETIAACRTAMAEDDDDDAGAAAEVIQLDSDL